LEAIIVAVKAMAKENILRIVKTANRRRTSISTSVSRNLKSDKDLRQRFPLKVSVKRLMLMSKIAPETASQLSPNIPVPS